MLRKFTSRKFLAALATVIAGIVAAFTGIAVNEDALVQVLIAIAGLLTAVAGSGVYAVSEARVDAAREAGPKSEIVRWAEQANFIERALRSGAINATEAERLYRELAKEFPQYAHLRPPAG